MIKKRVHDSSQETSQSYSESTRLFRKTLKQPSEAPSSSANVAEIDSELLKAPEDTSESQLTSNVDSISNFYGMNQDNIAEEGSSLQPNQYIDLRQFNEEINKGTVSSEVAMRKKAFLKDKRRQEALHGRVQGRPIEVFTFIQNKQSPKKCVLSKRSEEFQDEYQKKYNLGLITAENSEVTNVQQMETSEVEP